MKLFHPAMRSMLPAVVFAILLGQTTACWILIRFVLVDAQNRVLAPEHYEMQVVTATEYSQLLDPTVNQVTYSDGGTMAKANVSDTSISAGYKPTERNDQYVRITTKGTAHVIPYVQPYLFMFSLLAGCGFLASLWNLRESRESTHAD